MSQSRSSLARSSSAQSSLASSSLARSAPATDTNPNATAPAVSDTPVKLTTDLSQMDAMPSPALDLQENLRNAWTLPAPTGSTATDDRKIPVGWALTAVALGCGAFWACIALVVF